MLPNRRALLIGSKMAGLTGPENDVAVLGDVLEDLDFTTRRLTGTGATADGIVAGYRELIADTEPDDAAVVYYSGHGSRGRVPGDDPAAPRWLQYIVPTDIEDRSDNRARCVLAEELSLLQLELTGRTRNATVILDCCHSARMSRNPMSVPRALDSVDLPEADLHRRWAELRESPRLVAVTTDSNPVSVRLVACSPDERAYEQPSAALGGVVHGLLTAALVNVLTHGTPAEMTWREVRDLVRVAVLQVEQQRPEVEGRTDRLLFSLATRDQTGVRPVQVVEGTALLDAAALFGSAVGDAYVLVPPRGGRARAPAVRAVVDRIVDGRAVLSLDSGTGADLPPGTAAWPLEVALGSRPVAVLPAGSPARPEVVTELGRTAHVRVVDDPSGALATVRLDGGVQLLDAGGEPLYQDGATPTPAVVADDVRTLARAAWVRNLSSGRGTEALADEVELSVLRLLPSGRLEPLEQGAHLFVGDRLVIRAHNRALRTLYVSVIDVGLAGLLDILNTSEPDGLTIAPDEIYELGRTGGRNGLPLSWVPGLPAGAPRGETIVTIISDAKIDGLAQLVQPGVVSRSGTVTTSVGRLLEDLAVGRRTRDAADLGTPVRYRVVSFDIVLHPGRRPAPGPAEPMFAIDQRPDDSVRLVTPSLRYGAEPVRRLGLRLVDLDVTGPVDHALRLDVLAVPAGEAFRARTVRVASGDTVPDSGLLLDEGRPGHFLDVALWVSPDEGGAEDLADLLAPAKPVTKGAAGAVAELVVAAARALGDRIGPGVVAAFRTVLVPHERFGTGDGARRHPAVGSLRADAVALALEIADTT
ncbi:caspase family protein [Actinomycetospora sp. CA-084318]|uniref:caspase family protein n=1 Tax=Actinomycetospora sp. CA-084318 TaxID=3239892 RepID=UPI003D98E932